MALQLMPRLLTTAIQSEGENYKVVILVATSGDTGKAALEGFADVEGVHIFVFYPHEGVSEIQRLQMVTQRGSNTGACAVIGNFDDAQTGVKTDLFRFGESMTGWRRFIIDSRPPIRSTGDGSLHRLFITTRPMRRWSLQGRSSAVKRSISAFLRETSGISLLPIMPSGCGLPVSKLICASNINKVLTDFIRTGVYDRRREFYKTESPSMDILISSNLERLLFELVGRKSCLGFRLDETIVDSRVVSDPPGCPGPTPVPVLWGVC